MPRSDRPKFVKRDSLVHQASVDREQNEVKRRKSTIRSQEELARCPLLMKEYSIHGSKDEKVGVEAQMSLMLNIKCTGNPQVVIGSVIIKFHEMGIGVQKFEVHQGSIRVTTLLQRKQYADSEDSESEKRILIECTGKKSTFLPALSNIISNHEITRIEIQPTRQTMMSAEKFKESLDEQDEPIWFPRNVCELDKCAHVVVKNEIIPVGYPGYEDSIYIKRRNELNQIANSYRYGSPIPIVEYTEEENLTWKLSYTKLKELREAHTCLEYRNNICEMVTAVLMNDIGAYKWRLGTNWTDYC